MFGASNELPERKELEALFDRFLLRYEVGYLIRPANL
jgi:MoxR-like ATPase